MDFALPQELVAYLAELDQFIADEIKPLEQQDDNIRFFDHRREYARTDFEMKACRATNGNCCCAKPRSGLTRPDIGAFRRRRNTAARMDRTCGWR
jgi:hypothetical protein